MSQMDSRHCNCLRSKANLWAKLASSNLAFNGFSLQWGDPRRDNGETGTELLRISRMVYHIIFKLKALAALVIKRGQLL